MLTGVMPDVSKVFAFEAIPELTMGARGSQTFFSVLRAHGYASYGAGKLFHWEPFGSPFSKFYACPEEQWSRCKFEYWPPDYNQEWGTEEDAQPECLSESSTCFRKDVYLSSDDDELFDSKVSSHALKYLKVGARDYAENGAPFVLGVGWHHPHLEWRIPRRLFHTNVSVASNHLPPVGAPPWAFGDIAIGSTSGLELLSGKVVSGRDFYRANPAKSSKMPRIPDEVARELRGGYMGCVAFLDEQVGRIVSGMRDAGIWEDAVVVFTADHGYGLGEHGHWGKSSLYEIDTRVPLFVRDPKLAAVGKKSKGLVELMDLGKTIIDIAAGVSPSHYRTIDGSSIRRLLVGSREADERWNRRRLVATTIMAKCRDKYAVPFGCPNKSYLWPSRAALLGIAARSTNFRYVAWMRFNTTLDQVDWSLAPVAEELYFHDDDDDDSQVDDWDSLNLLSAKATRRRSSTANALERQQDEISFRAIGNQHLSWLRDSARRRHTRAYGDYPFRYHSDLYGFKNGDNDVIPTRK